LRRLRDRIEASEERCVASRYSVRQTLDFIAMSRAAIARSREQVARFNLPPIPLAPGAPPSGQSGSRWSIHLRRRPGLAGRFGSDLG
jgi:hypothetical protein